MPRAARKYGAPMSSLAPTVIQVLQPGYRTPDKVLRAARVAVADPP